MTAIEVVTAKELTKTYIDENGDRQIYHVRVWNATVANLTLMALGSSAPEILLNLLEVLLNSFNSGPLGPSTIVGSAAFNLMVISAVCILCLPDGEKRTLKQLGVFLTTAFYSVLAYVWLLLIVVVISPEVITISEAVITCIFLLILIIQAYAVDRWSTIQSTKKYKTVSGKGGAVNKKEAAAAVKAASLSKDASPEEIHQALADELLPPKSKAYYRKQTSVAKSGGNTTTKVTPSVEDDEPAKKRALTKAMSVATNITFDASAPGIIRWKHHTADIKESGGMITLSVLRLGGSKGEVSVDFATKNQKALAGKDFEAKNGTLTWADGDMEDKYVEITIFDDDEFEKDEDFTVVLSEPKGGCAFPVATDGGEDTDVCTVTIVNDDDRATRLVEAIRLLRMDADQLNLASEDWSGAMMEAIVPPSGGMYNKMMHFLMLPWKLMFAVLPPPGLCGGYPCFFASLLAIGIQVVLISDFANQLGCQLYIKPSVTAITFVALGTSLPDTFASMQAARGDKYADNSVGNVTGSNSVNVFFGLGLPWLLGAVYWAASGPGEGEGSFAARFGPGGPHELPPDLFALHASTGAFVVRSGDLALSVTVFTICAVLTLLLILVRRMFGGQELGGNKMGAYASAGFLIFLWLVYVVVSCLATYGFVSM